MTRWPYFPIAVGSLFVSIVTSTVILILGEGLIMIPTYEYLSEHKSLYESWTAQPFVEIALEDAALGCRAGFEPLLYREWPGTKDLCQGIANTDENFEIDTYGER